jgi:hypothetical protein
MESQEGAEPQPIQKTGFLFLDGLKILIPAFAGMTEGK